MSVVFGKLMVSVEKPTRYLTIQLLSCFDNLLFKYVPMGYSSIDPLILGYNQGIKIDNEESKHSLR